MEISRLWQCTLVRPDWRPCDEMREMRSQRRDRDVAIARADHLHSPTWRAARLIGTARLVFAIFSLLCVWLDATERGDEAGAGTLTVALSDCPARGRRPRGRRLPARLRAAEQPALLGVELPPDRHDPHSRPARLERDVRITVVLADDHPLVLRGLQGLLSGEVDFQVVAQCANGVDALRSIQTYQPELAVVDLSMPQRDGLWVLREVNREKLRTRVVLLAASIDEHQMVEARRFGVGGVVLKDMAPRLLLQCLRKVYSGELWIEHRVAARALDMLLQREEGAREIGSILTTREVEIARLVASGLRNRCIAERLFVSEATVKTHLHNIYDKLNVESRGQLILYCADRGIGRMPAS